MCLAFDKAITLHELSSKLQMARLHAYRTVNDGNFTLKPKLQVRIPDHRDRDFRANVTGDSGRS